jgi:amidase
VACGFTSFEIGTDIGGSIRVPASFCGVWGHKPSFGLVPGLGYLDHALGGTTEADVNVLGPIARSVDDLALVLDVIAGPTPDRAVAWKVDLPAPRHGRLTDFRVAAWLDDPACPVQGEVVEVMERAVRALEAAGVKVDRRARPAIDFTETSDLGIELIALATTLGTDDATFDRLCRADGETVDPGHAARLRRITQRHRGWLAGDRARAAVRQRWAELFRDFDVVLAPVCASAPIAHLQEGTFADRVVTIDGIERPYVDLIRWTSLIGMAYLPVTVPPLGRTAGGLPVGIQVVGPYLEDRTAMHFARLLADAAGTGYEPPPLARR